MNRTTPLRMRLKTLLLHNKTTKPKSSFTFNTLIHCFIHGCCHQINPDLLSHTALLSAYCRLPYVRPEIVLQKYQQITQVFRFPPDIVLHNTLLYGLCRSADKLSSHAFLEEMARLGVTPDTVTYSILLDSAFKSGNSAEAKRLHGEMVRRGIHLDIIACTVIIDGLFKAGEGDEALYMFQSLQKLGVASNGVTYSSLINGLCLVGDLKAAEIAVGYIRNNDLHTLTVAYSTLINGYAKRGMVDEALEFLRKMEACGIPPNDVIYSTLIHHLRKSKREVEALKMYEEMKCKGVEETDSFALDGVLNVLKKSWRMKEAAAIFELVVEHISPDIVVYTSLMHGYFKEGDEGAALGVAQEIQEKNLRFDTAAYNVLLTGLLNSKKKYRAESVYHQMKEMGMVPNEITYESMFKAYLREGNMKSYAWNLLEEMKSQGVYPTTFCCNTVVNGLCAENDTEKALEFLEELGSPPSEASHRAILDRLSIQKNSHMVLSSHRRLLNMGMELSVSVWNKLVWSLCRAGMLTKARWAVEEMEKKGINADVDTYNALIHGYMRRNQVERAMRLCEKMEEKGMEMNKWTTKEMVRGLCRLGEVERGREYMRERGEEGDGDTYEWMVRGYGKVGDEKGVIGAYCEMVGRGYVPKVDTYNEMIMCFVRRGKVKEGMELVKEMKWRGRRPRSSTYGIVIRGLCVGEGGRRVGWWREGVKKMLGEMGDDGFSPSRWTVRCLCRALARPGKSEEAERLVEEMFPKK